MLFEKSGHFDNGCPCVRCAAKNCDGCQDEEVRKKGYAVDTDKLCPAAKEYCEGGREDE